jgi:hypothetical protein
VDSEGVPKNPTIIETTEPTWADEALRELMKWRFTPASVNGQRVAVEGVLELAVGQVRPAGQTNVNP